MSEHLNEGKRVAKEAANEVATSIAADLKASANKETLSKPLTIIMIILSVAAIYQFPWIVGIAVLVAFLVMVVSKLGLKGTITLAKGIVSSLKKAKAPTTPSVSQLPTIQVKSKKETSKTKTEE